MRVRTLGGLLLWAVLPPWASAAPPPFTPADTVAVITTRYTPVVHAYAQVEPIRTLTLRAPVNGVITRLTVLPGSEVSTGTALAQIRGPQVQSALRGALEAVRSARAATALAQKRLTMDREMPRGFVTRLQMSEAQTAVTQAQASLHQAQAQQRSIQKSVHIPALAAAVVVNVLVANGERVSAGDPLLILQPARGLWLRTTLYGEQAEGLRTGLRGVFRPLNGGAAIPVRVQTIIPPLTADGGVQIGCVSLSPKAGWRNGEAGTVDIDVGLPRSLPSVPESALVMDQGKWWVLLAHGSHLRRQLVTPGPSTNGWTTVLTGLRDGERVIARNAYLLFHISISQHYTPPD